MGASLLRLWMMVVLQLLHVLLMLWGGAAEGGGVMGWAAPSSCRSPIGHRAGSSTAAASVVPIFAPVRGGQQNLAANDVVVAAGAGVVLASRLQGVDGQSGTHTPASSHPVAAAATVPAIVPSSQR